jgi:hypothetical protein
MSTPDDAAERVAAYARHYLNVKTLLLNETDRDNMAAVLEDVRLNDTTYLVYQDEGSNLKAVLVPWKLYTELAAAKEDNERPTET